MNTATDLSKPNETEESCPQNFSPSPDFKWLCEELFKKLDNVQKVNGQSAGLKPISVRYYEVINNFINLWRSTVGSDIFPALVLILPYRDRRVYNMKDYTLVKAICSYLKLSKNSSTERRLIRWKKRASRGVRLSDFCVDEIKKRKKRPSSGEHISIDKLNEILDKLAEERNAKGNGYKGVSESPSFKYCLDMMSFIELKYFFDIILKNRVIGGQEHKFLNCWHPDAQDYLSVVSDLKIVASKLWDPSSRLGNSELTVNIGYAFQPHLAKKLSIAYDKICRKLGNDFFIEEKMDGERIQLHFMNYGNKLKFFSRRGIDYTYLYGQTIKEGTVSPFLRLDQNVKECVMDGEMVTFDSEKNVVLPFGLVKSSAKIALTTEGICSPGYRPLFMVLDLVYLNGVSLTKLPLFRRKEYLRQILSPYPHVVEILPYIRCSEPKSIKKSLQTAISMGSEGIILKKYNSRYIFGARNDSCIKVKPEYLEQFGENMDLIIIGRTPARKDSLMCGLAVYEGEDDPPRAHTRQEVVNLDSDVEENEEDYTLKKIKKFVSFCVIANGISQEEFREIDRRTRGCWKRTEDTFPSEDMLEFGSKLPEEWIDPKQSLVIEVKARSLDNTESSEKKFKAGCTLYGGYCRRIRYDKDWTSSYSLSELYQERRNKSHYFGPKTNHTILNRDKSSKSKELKTLEPQLEDVGGDNHGFQIFDGLLFYIMSDYVQPWNEERITKEQLNCYVIKNGGKIINNLIAKHKDEKRYRLISGRITMECRMLIERGYDIISPRWILDCIANRSLLSLEPQHCFRVSEELMEIVRRRVDKFGDSYDVDVSERQLGLLIKSAINDSGFPSTGSESLNNPELCRIPLFLFNGRVFHIPTVYQKEASPAVVERVKVFGGKFSCTISSCNIILVSDLKGRKRDQVVADLRSEISLLVNENGSPPAIPRIVTFEWLYRSIEEECQLSEEDFYPI